ncbi:Pseudouridylate synthase 7 like protein [Tritrichomonas foetus]|uniref:Pseudouridylate synthase 7 like protein n=1 Tax=Tritrichomonas foetus TaxID=1144522 RepID=A0A1J4KB08_9EUKA|nr:Pseudouridylate synthase 7 like protein [Tritrichomonas foetus]|eukprot:OHT06878.1 Pseudouridylate synthase 7 like protein [Tritrichomonas foetus]
MATQSATEESVGCRCFANDAPEMSGIIKHKYSDFHVNEIDKNGNVVHLTTLDEIPEAPYPAGYEEWLSSREFSFSFMPESEEQIARINYEQTSFSVFQDSTGKVTVERLYKKKARPFITKFVLYKENTNQQSAISRVAQKVGKQSKLIGFAGSKDKRGITTQICSIRDVPPHRLFEAVGNLGDNIKVGHIRYAMNPVSLGDLSGNRFSIVLRDIKLTDKEENVYKGLKTRLEKLDKSGFINYFGMQRFGTGTIPTHKIGELVLKKQWKKIIELLLEPQKGEISQLYEAKVHFKKLHDPKQALKMTPHSAQTEISLFKAMSLLPADKMLSNPHELFSRIDRRQRMMYVHAYQSYLWNHMVSQRIEKHGNQVVVGDYVLDNVNLTKSEKTAILVTNANINNYSIFDVVIPLPSGSQQMPTELIELMSQDGVTPDMFKSLSSEYGAGGDWRYIMSKAKDLDWELIRHDDFDAPLIDSDLNIIEGTTNRINHVENGKYASLRISFSLGSGQYATMCLRELLKRSTEWFKDSEMSQRNEPQTHWWQSVCNIC